MDDRQPMTPEEFDRACRELTTLQPNLSETSGKRSVVRNAEVGGNPASKHIYGMARDFVAGHEEELVQAAIVAQVLGLWYVVHDAGSGDHLHVQGLAPGPIPDWWLGKYAKKTEG